MSGRTLQARLDGKTAIITGASRGIGLAVAHRLVDEGARVCLTARKVEPLQSVVDQFPEGSAILVAGKFDDPLHRQEVFERVSLDFGRLDILVNGVGINPVYSSLMELDLEVARKMIEVNLLATLAWVQEAYRREDLTFAAAGSVINLSSVVGQVPSPGVGLYGITKAASDHLTRTLAVELGPNIRVNSVAPAVITTHFSRALYEGKESEVAARYPMGRLGTPEDVASVVAFLASDDSSWLTGQVINLDGGLLAAGGIA